jgi:hypothetical protein
MRLYPSYPYHGNFRSEKEREVTKLGRRLAKSATLGSLSC